MVTDNGSFKWPAADGAGGGVTSLNTLTGAVVLAAGNNISLTPVGNTITIATAADGILSINTDTTADQTIVTASTGTDFTIATSSGVTTVAIPSASATARGLVTTGTQTIAGNKTFSGSISASNFSGSSSGTNTGDVTLSAVGSSPSANGASLSGQVLTLQPADDTRPGLITSGAQAIGGAKTFSSAPVMSFLGAVRVVATDSGKALTDLVYTSSNTAPSLVLRDGSGNFSAGTITAALTGTASGNATITPTNHGVVISGAANAMTAVGPGTTGQVLRAQTGADPVYGAVVLTTDVTGVLPVANGGTSLATLTAHALYVGNGASAPTALSVGATGTVLHGNSGADPSYSAVSLTADVSGVLPVANGGHGVGTLAAHGVIIGNGTSAVNVTSAGTSGQVLTSNGASADPTYQTVTVVSNNSSGERIERAYIANNGTASITSQSGTWLSSVTRNGAGDVTVNIAGGIFSGTPSVSIIAVDNSAREITLSTTTPISSTVFRVLIVNTLFAGADDDFVVIAMGPR